MRGFVYRFQIRTIICTVFLSAMMLLCIVRIISICTDSKLASNTSNTVTVELQSGRGDIYDSLGRRITSSALKYAVVFLPCDEAIMRFAKETSGDEREAGLTKLRQKKPAVITREEPINDIGIYSFKVRDRYADLESLEHIIGYLGADGHGVSGIEKAYDELLFSENDHSVSFALDASGNFLLGSEPNVTNEPSGSAVYLTIEREIQNIAAAAAEEIEKGAVVVSEIATGKIKAMVSKPSFEINNVSAYISSDDSPFLNRALAAFSVGSVFKPLIASAMLELNKGDFSHICEGYSEFLGLRFYCNKHNGHGLMDMNQAITLSCNTYFYNGAQQVPAGSLTSLASAFGFSNSVQLADGIFADKGSITSYEQLSASSASIANYAIGQGNIALSPLVLCNLYSAIANDGVYYDTSLIEGIIENGSYKKLQSGGKNVVISKATAAVLKKDLISVVENGTGTSAKPESGGAGGKTATAQTGRFNGQDEIDNGWFCGFFPAKEPKYVVVVMVEDAVSGSGDCGPIFKKIADGIIQMNKKE